MVRFFRVFTDNKQARRKFYMRKIYSRYRNSVKIILAIVSLQGIISNSTYWLEDGIDVLASDMIFRAIYVSFTLASTVLIITNNSISSYTYFKVVLLIGIGLLTTT